MKKRRDAFSMVELIFVIIILGLLMGIALPRLVETRDDAKLSVEAHNIMAGAEDIASYAVMHARIKPHLSDMSYAIKHAVEDGVAQDQGGYVVKYKAIGVDDCVRLKVQNPNQATAVLKIENGGGGGEDCAHLRDMIDPGAFPIPLHGSRISF